MPVKKTIQGTTYEISRSNRQGKKLMAKYTNKETGKQNTIHFGDSKMEQYKDKTGIWSHKDHNDPERRKRYIDRHKANENWSKPSAGLLSRYILW